MTTGISCSVSKFTAVTDVSESEKKGNDPRKLSMTEDMLRVVTIAAQFISNRQEMDIPDSFIIRLI